MSGGPNPAIWADAARRGLESSEADAANAHDAINKQAALDESDLQQLEHAEYYPEAEPTALPSPAPAKRSLVDRLVRRHSR